MVSIFLFSYIKLSSPNLNNVMVLGAMHIYLSILLFGYDEWFFDRNLLGQACMVKLNLLKENIFLMNFGFTVTNISPSGWIFIDVWFDVFKNFTCLSYFYIS